MQPASQPGDIEDVDEDDWAIISSSTTTTTSSNTAGLTVSLQRPLPRLPTSPKSESSGPSLRQLLPDLETIYIVDCNSIHTSTSYVRSPRQVPVVVTDDRKSIRICASCVKPRIVLRCDGAWKCTSQGFCSLHMSCMLRGEGLPVHQRDIIGAVMQAVQPFSRAELESIGLKKVDISSPADSIKYEHVTGCKCETAFLNRRYP